MQGKNTAASLLNTRGSSPAPFSPHLRVDFPRPDLMGLLFFFSCPFFFLPLYIPADMFPLSPSPTVLPALSDSSSGEERSSCF
ncbi:hypothetical protein GDO78_003465 [Eleutherodactylus coqui]|uniref:Transmembrane protein n=1 Tax=Eleutherodactylus coqui TaxID=57060 RepID=A0A8J6ESE9_ELECQ|nr:hypothetical protein GDO78_003465 [Eleutherodactylus coqui]